MRGDDNLFIILSICTSVFLISFLCSLTILLWDLALKNVKTFSLFFLFSFLFFRWGPEDSWALSALALLGAPHCMNSAVTELVFWTFFFFFLNFFFFISWRLITLQYCSGFCHTLKWISHGFTCIPHPDPPSHLPLYPIPLGLPSAPGPSACLMHPTWAGDLFHPR